jgi:hypothetical protein
VAPPEPENRWKHRGKMEDLWKCMAEIWENHENSWRNKEKRCKNVEKHGKLWQTYGRIHGKRWTWWGISWINGNMI